MAYVVMVDTPGMTTELYDKSGEMMGMKGRPPEGCLVHIAGPGPEGWRIVSVWDSLEKAREFATTILGPVQAQLGVAPVKPPVVWQLYSLDVAPQPSAAGSV